MRKLELHWQIIIALGLAIMAGLAFSPTSSVFDIRIYAVFDFVGTLFLNALKMIIVPLIIASLITGIAGIGGSKGLGRLGGKAILFYMTSSLLAILTGLFFVNLFNPGIIDGQAAKEVLGLSSDAIASVESKVAGKSTSDIAGVFLSMVPPNVVSAAANGQMLGLIFFSILFGYFMTRINEPYAEAQYNFWQGLFEVMMKITEWVMKFAPIGVFALVAKVVMTTGLGAFKPLAVFFFTVLLAHFLIILPLLLKLVTRLNPVHQFRAMAPALLTAFSTSSSSATLPLTLECVEKNAGVSNRTSSFVLPLGATVNMDGTALYECVAALFIAQAYGLELSLATQFTVVVVALLTSIGVAGIPAASLVAISIILGTIGLPAEGIGLILAVDRVLDMCRTAVNIFSDSCGAVIIAHTEGEENLLPETKQA